jgi:hypothetical protein
MKRDIVVSKLMYDKSMVVDKYMANSFNDRALGSMYTALSAESRKYLLNGYNYILEDDTNSFHKLIGFRRDDVDLNAPVTNELILNLCNNFVTLDDLNYDHGSIATSRGGTAEESAYRDDMVRYIESEQQQEEPKITPMVIKNEVNVELCTTYEIDEVFDHETFKFFQEFLANNDNHPIKDKVEKLIEIFELNREMSGLSNKMKNEIMKNLKTEYLAELEFLNSKL